MSFAVLRTRTDLPDGQTSLSHPEHPLTHLLSHGHSSLQSASPRRQELIQLVSVVSQFSTQVKASSAHLFRQISFSGRSLKKIRTNLTVDTVCNVLKHHIDLSYPSDNNYLRTIVIEVYCSYGATANDSKSQPREYHFYQF